MGIEKNILKQLTMKNKYDMVLLTYSKRAKITYINKNGEEDKKDMKTG